MPTDENYNADHGKRSDVENFLYNIEVEQEELSQLINEQLKSHPDLSSERARLLVDVNKEVNQYHDILEKLKDQNQKNAIPVNKLQEELEQAHEYFQWVKSSELPRAINGGVA